MSDAGALPPGRAAAEADQDVRSPDSQHAHIETPSAAPALEDSRVGPDAPWRRLDRRMLFVHPVTELIRFFPVLFVLFVFRRSSGGSDQYWHLGGVALVVAIGLLRYVTTSYRITPEQIQLRKGLVSRHILSARLDRVRTVDLTSSPIHRLLGLSKVVIGTGSSSSKRDEDLSLDALGTPEARGLREELLHRRAGGAIAAPPGEVVPGPVAVSGSSDAAVPVPAGRTGVADVPGPAAPGDRVVVRLDPAWIRFAPLTTSGVVVGAAGLGFLANLLNQSSNNAWGQAWNYLQSWSLGWTVTIAIGLLVLVVGVAVLAIAGYVLANWGLVVSHDAFGHSYHLRRGLLTTRETSIDERRVRGLEIGEPLGLRLAHGGRLAVIVTGLSRKRGSAATLVPPAPVAVVAEVGEEVLGETGPLTVPLIPHGPAARRRRLTRALVPALLLMVVVVLLVVVVHWPWWLLVLAAIPVLIAAPLARDRYASLGHALSGRYLVVRSGSFNRRRDALERDGIIGWNVRQSIFQRRVGVVSLTATTAAGHQEYTAYDIPVARAVAFADEATPGMLSEFLT